VIHSTRDLGKAKVLSAKEAITALNPECEVTLYQERVNVSNVRRIVKDWDVVLDGSDNFPTRFLVADHCWMEKVPLVSAAAVRFQGQLMTIMPGEGNPCYRCIFPEPPPPGMVPSCQEAGILGAVVGVMGALQALEAIKVLLGLDEILRHRLLLYDALESKFMSLKRSPDPGCALCGRNPTISSLKEYAFACTDEREDTEHDIKAREL
jgi:adenylyltransferase/sulfurtransferase